MNVQFVSGKFFAWDNNGNPYVGAKVWAYKSPKTSTPIDSYSDPDCTVPNTWPVVLNVRGEAFIYTNTATDFYLTTPTATDISSPIWVSLSVGAQQAGFIPGATTPGTTDNNYVVSAIPVAVTALYENMMLIMTPDVDNAATLVSTVFTGTGINDLIASGAYIGSTSGSIFPIEIDSLARQSDSYIKLLLHGDGTGATIVDSSATPKTVTVHGDATQVTDADALGGKAIQFDGTGDYLSLADSDDWYLGTGDFTIEGFWTPSAVTDATFVAQHVDANNTFYFDYVASTHKIRVYYKDAGAPSVKADYDYTWTPVAATRYHIELVRSGSNLYLFIDGVKITWTTTTTAISTHSLNNLAGLLTIGYGANVGTYFAGNLDEFCWSKGIARHTADFDPPTQAYADGGVDTFKYHKDAALIGSGIAITSLGQDLIEGLVVTFSVLTGHTLGDIWAITVKTPARILLDNLPDLISYPHGLIAYKNRGGSVVALDGGDMKAGYPAQLILNAALNAWLLINPATPTFSTPTITANRYRKNIIADYDMILTDQGYELSCVGTFTITLLTPPEFSGRFLYIRNSGTGLITVDAGTYTIWGIGESTLLLGPGACFQFDTNGTDWHTLTSMGEMMLFNRTTMNAEASVTVDNLMPGTRYLLKFNGTIASTGGAIYPYLLFNSDGGANYTRIGWSQWMGNAAVLVYDAGDVRFNLTTSVATVIAGLLMVSIEFETESGDSHNVVAESKSKYYEQSGVAGYSVAEMTCVYTGAADLSSLTFIGTGCTFTGTFLLYQYA